jgi:hypothetical protein
MSNCNSRVLELPFSVGVEECCPIFGDLSVVLFATWTDLRRCNPGCACRNVRFFLASLCRRVHIENCVCSLPLLYCPGMSSTANFSNPSDVGENFKPNVEETVSDDDQYHGGVEEPSRNEYRPQSQSKLPGQADAHLPALSVNEGSLAAASRSLASSETHSSNGRGSFGSSSSKPQSGVAPPSTPGVAQGIRQTRPYSAARSSISSKVQEPQSDGDDEDSEDDMNHSEEHRSITNSRPTSAAAASIRGERLRSNSRSRNDLSSKSKEVVEHFTAISLYSFDGAPNGHLYTTLSSECDPEIPLVSEWEHVTPIMPAVNRYQQAVSQFFKFLQFVFYPFALLCHEGTRFLGVIVHYLVVKPLFAITELVVKPSLNAIWYCLQPLYKFAEAALVPAGKLVIWILHELRACFSGVAASYRSGKAQGTAETPIAQDA